MSAYAFGQLAAKRQGQPAGKTKNEAQPGLSSYVDILAALVPAEVLAVNAALLPLMTDSSKNSDGKSVTTISDPSTLKLVFVLSIIFSIGLFIFGHLQQARKDRKPDDGKVLYQGSDWLRMLIPGAAYVAWVMLVKASAWDAWAPGMKESLRFTIAVFAALALGAVAGALSNKADAATPPNGPAPKPDPPAGE